MKATITTLSPVHIGNGNSYNKGIDFVQIGNRIGKVDEEKVLNLIGIENIGQWVSAIENFNPDRTYQKQILLDFLEKRGIRNITLEEICSQISVIKSSSGKSTQLKEQFRTKIKGLSIPGSSLKGALKTAILDHFTSNKQHLSNLKIENYKNKKNKWSDNFIESKFFGKDANSKITRFLKVGDIHFENVQSHIYETFILNAYTNDWHFKENQQILVESIPKGVSSSFELKIDNDLLNRNIKKENEDERKWNNNPNNKRRPFNKKWTKWKLLPLQNDLHNLASINNTFITAILNFEIENLSRQSLNNAGELLIEKYINLKEEVDKLNENEFVVRVGANSGYLFTTGQWIDKEGITLEDDDYFHLRKIIQKKDYSDMDIWPKTRKITREGEVFGFVKISF